MNEKDRWEGQYRRPRPHLAMEPNTVRPTIDRRQLLSGTAMLLGEEGMERLSRARVAVFGVGGVGGFAAEALLLIVALVPKGTVDDAPDAAQVRTDPQLRTSADCQIIQHMTYAPCGHDLTRRQTIPQELSGKGREELSAAYEGWQITSFASAEVVMEQSLPLYCPEHVVLLPDESGMLCVFQNKYGDALALIKELDLLLTELPDDVQQLVRKGKGFATIEELEKWLEGADS